MTPIEIALIYIRRGWAVVPVPFKSKRPRATHGKTCGSPRPTRINISTARCKMSA
jgi:hypothetical protein